MILPPPTSTLFPYTTLFRSRTASPPTRTSLARLPIFAAVGPTRGFGRRFTGRRSQLRRVKQGFFMEGDRKSTRLNSSHQIISYAVFCLKKKKKKKNHKIKIK